MIKKTISLTTGSEISEITSVLTECFGITYFAYVKSFPDGTHFFLSNNTPWTECFYQYYFEFGTFHKTINNYQDSYVLWSTTGIKDQIVFNACREQFDIAHGITLIKKREQYCEFYGFGTTRDNYRIIDFYLNHMDLLEKFIVYFKENANSLIIKAESDRLILPKLFNVKDDDKDFLPYAISDQNIDRFLKEICPKSSNTVVTDLKQLLTQRELDCLTLTIQGKTAKEVAKILHISPRTVETYLNQIKIKFDCKNKYQLLSKIMQLHLK